MTFGSLEGAMGEAGEERTKQREFEPKFAAADMAELHAAHGAMVRQGGKGFLFAYEGPKTGYVVLTDAVVTIGSDPTNTFRIEDSSVSRKHCEVRSKQDGIYVKDRVSTNGTFVNGSRVEAGNEQKLDAGNIIAVGAARIYFHKG